MKSVFRFVMLVMVFIVLANALVNPFSMADKTGTSATQQLVGNGYARWVLFITPTTNGAVVRIGGSTTSATVGAPVAAGAGLFFPPIPVDQGQPVSTNNYYDLSAIYFYAVTSDKLSVIWAN